MESPQQPEHYFNPNVFREDNLRLLAQQLQRVNPAGYPEFSQRLWGSEVNWFIPVALPMGPWETSEGTLPSIPEQAALADRVRQMDAHGRPLHPWFDQMITDPRIGVVTGKGFFWNWGPNYTADPIVVRYDHDEPYVLLITRQDTGQWALPGGFVDAEDTDTLDAAKREAQEEALIDLSDERIQASQIYQGPLADIRVTAHAWPETTAFRFDLPDDIARDLPLTPYRAGDDAVEACWHPASKIKELLLSSHQLLVAQALAKRI